MHKNLSIIGVTGILDPDAVSILAPLTRHKGALLSTITHTELPSAVVSVLFHFMREMNWKRIGLLTESADEYYFSIAETLQRQVINGYDSNGNESIVISPYIELSHMTLAIKKIVKLNTKIIFASLDAEWSIKLLCAAWEAGLVWPEYAWIFHGIPPKDLLTEPTPVCDIEKAVNGIFIINDEPRSDLSHSEALSGITFSKYYKRYLSSLSETALQYNVTLRPNGYAKLLYDLVWTMAVTEQKHLLPQHY